MDKVSIIVPVYNVNVDYFDICIESLIGQDYENFEIIIVDDGSNKEIADICDTYSKKYDFIFSFHKKNEGVSIARNYGISKSTGKWLLFVDADDWMEKDAISNLINGSSNKEIIYSRCFINDDKPDFGEFENKEYTNKEIIEYMFYQSKLLYLFIECPWGKMYLKEAICKNDINFTKGIPKGEDMLFNFDYLRAISEIGCIDDYTYHYRKNDESVTRKYDANYIEKDKILLAEVKKRFENGDYPKNYFYFLTIRLLHRANKNYLFCSRYNLSKKERKSILHNMINDDLYHESIWGIKIGSLGIGRRILVILLRLKLYFLLPLLYINY